MQWVRLRIFVCIDSSVLYIYSVAQWASHEKDGCGKFMIGATKIIATKIIALQVMQV